MVIFYGFGYKYMTTNESIEKMTKVVRDHFNGQIEQSRMKLDRINEEFVIEVQKVKASASALYRLHDFFETEIEEIEKSS